MLTIAGIVLTIHFPDSTSEIMTLVVGYVGAEGAADVAQRYQEQKTLQQEQITQQQRINYGLDSDSVADIPSGQVVPGSQVAEFDDSY